jgi:hypothetical protein
MLCGKPKWPRLYETMVVPKRNPTLLMLTTDLRNMFTSLGEPPYFHIISCYRDDL